MVDSMKKKAQWLDLMLAYGWAVALVIIVIIAYVYFAVLREANVVETACEFPSTLSCIDAPVGNSTEHSISFRLVNTLGFAITNINGTSKGVANCLSMNTSSAVVSDTTVVKIFLQNCSNDFGVKFDDQVSLRYINKDTGESGEKVGRVVGRSE